MCFNFDGFFPFERKMTGFRKHDCHQECSLAFANGNPVADKKALSFSNFSYDVSTDETLTQLRFYE